MDDCGIVVSSLDPTGVLWDPESHDAEQCTANKCSLCFWKLHGRNMLETMVDMSPDGTQSVAWVFQTRTGVGCRLCYLRHKKKKDQKSSGRRRERGHRPIMPLAYDQGTAQPRHKGHLVGHAASRVHTLAVASFFDVEPTIRLNPNTLVESLPSGVPTPKDWWMVILLQSFFNSQRSNANFAILLCLSVWARVCVHISVL